MFPNKYFLYFQFPPYTYTLYFLTYILCIFNFHAVHIHYFSFIFILSGIERMFLSKNVRFATYAHRAPWRLSMVHIKRVTVTPAVYQCCGFFFNFFALTFIALGRNYIASTPSRCWVLIRLSDSSSPSHFSAEPWMLALDNDKLCAPWHVSSLKNECTTSCKHNALKIAFKRRNISYGRETWHNIRQNRRIIAICVCLGFFRRWKTRALRSARIMQWKERLNRRNISNGREIKHYIPQNRRIFAICVCRGLFRRRRTGVHYVLHNAMKRACTRRNISNGREIKHYIPQNRRIFAICVCRGLFRRRTGAHYVLHNAVKRACTRRNISNGREISLNCLQNRRIIAICVCLILFRCWKTGVHHVVQA